MAHARPYYADKGLSAAFYDVITDADTRLSGDVEIYAGLAPPGGAVLELGAGTGRVTRALLRAGAEVVAVDRSAPMLAHARERIARLPEAQRARVRWQVADLRRLRLRRRFGLVIAPFNLFMHLYSRADVEAALAAIARHLAPGGRLAFDVLMPDLGVLRRDPARVYSCRPVHDPTDGARYAYGESFDYDPQRQVQTVRMLFQRVDKPEIERETPLSLRFYFPEELSALLHYNRFRIEARYGDFAGAAPDAGSEHQVIVARLRR
jgi:SAM-dependent methyltransferase